MSTTGDPLMRYYACFKFCGKTPVDPMDGMPPVLSALARICIDSCPCPVVVARQGHTAGEACRQHLLRHCKSHAPTPQQGRNNPLSQPLSLTA